MMVLLLNTTGSPMMDSPTEANAVVVSEGKHKTIAKPKLGAGAIGALALGATALGCIAIGAASIGALFIGRARVKSLRIDELEVGRLIVRERDGEGR